MADRIAVFVRNIPFDTTQQEMLEHFSTVGQVLSFTIHYDRETGRPKGTGECVFRDAAVAESAIANLNGSVFRDNVLRVSRDQADRAPGDARAGGPGTSRAIQIGTAPSAAAALLAAPAQPSRITQVLKSLSQQEQLEVLSEFKTLLDQQPEVARSLLSESPQLAVALLEIQLLFGLITPQDVASIAAPAGAAAAPAHAPAQQQQQQQQVYAAPAPATAAAAPVAAASAPAVASGPSQDVLQALPALHPDQRAVLRQCLTLDEAQLSQLPPDLLSFVRTLKEMQRNGVQIPL